MPAVTALIKAVAGNPPPFHHGWSAFVASILATLKIVKPDNLIGSALIQAVYSATRREKIEEAIAGTYRPHWAAGEIFCHRYASELSRGEVGIRIEHLLADTNLEMQMWARSSPGRTHKGYLLPFPYLLAGPDQDPTRMGIVCEYISTVINEDSLAVTAIALTAARGNNRTVRACKDRMAFTRGYVQSRVEDPSAEPKP